MGCTSSILYHRDNAAAITTMGRAVLRKLGDLMTEHGCETIIAMDTDSVTATIPPQIENKKQLDAMQNEINQELAKISPLFKVEADETILSMWNIARKNYVWLATKGDWHRGL